MSKSIPVELPDIGSFENVDVIDVLVAPGDVVRKEQSIITLESDKAAMDIPAPAAGTVSALHVKVGDKLSKGALILTLDAEESAAPAPAAAAPPEPQESATGPIARTVQTEVAVLGAGVGGYTAAFRAADLGKKAVLIERHPVLGGVCLNVGCIPSKALLHAAEVISEAAEIAHMGVRFGPPEIDLDAMRAGKERVVGRLSAGVSQLAKQRKVTVLQGQGRFDAPNRLVVQTAEGAVAVEFEHCVVACGSRPVEIAGFPYDDPRLMDSTGALALADIPARLLVIGGGIIGMEMATVYGALGSRVDVVELQEGLIPGCDRDLVKPLQKRMEKRLNRILLGTRVKEIKPRAEGLEVQLEGKGAPITETYDRVLVAVGRAPNGRRINAEAAGVKVDDRGFIPVDAHMRTNVPHIFAIGDVVGNPMLAHKAAHEGKVAAEVIPDGDPLGGLHRSRDRLDGADRDGGEGQGHRLRERRAALVGQRPRPGHRPRRGPHQAPVRPGDEARPRGRHRRAQCRRADRGGRAGARDGGRCRGHRSDHPSAPDAERDHRPGGGDGGGDHHGHLAPQEEVEPHPAGRELGASAIRSVAERQYVAAGIRQTRRTARSCDG